MSHLSDSISYPTHAEKLHINMLHLLSLCNPHPRPVLTTMSPLPLTCCSLDTAIPLHHRMSFSPVSSMCYKGYHIGKCYWFSVTVSEKESLGDFVLILCNSLIISATGKFNPSFCCSWRARFRADITETHGYEHWELSNSRKWVTLSNTAHAQQWLAAKTHSNSQRTLKNRMPCILAVFVWVRLY